MMILCSLLRNYEENISEVDQSTLDQISTLIRKVINTENFRTKKDETYENKTLILDNIENVDIKKSDVVEKNPEDLIFFRQLKRGN